MVCDNDVMKMLKKARSGQYHAYLLRLWQEDETKEWRALIEDAHSDARRGFATLEALFEHLRQLTGGEETSGDYPILFKGEGK